MHMAGGSPCSERLGAARLTSDKSTRAEPSRGGPIRVRWSERHDRLAASQRGAEPRPGRARVGAACYGRKRSGRHSAAAAPVRRQRPGARAACRSYARPARAQLHGHGVMQDRRVGTGRACSCGGHPVPERLGVTVRWQRHPPFFLCFSCGVLDDRRRVRAQLGGGAASWPARVVGGDATPGWVRVASGGAAPGRRGCCFRQMTT